MKKNTFFFYKLFLCTLATLITLSGCSPEKNICKCKTLTIIAQQLERLDESCLVIFDIDETLITPTNPLLHVRSFKESLWLYYYYVTATRNFRFSRLFKGYNQALLNATYKLVDPNTPELLARLQRNNVKVIGITSFPTRTTGNYRKIEAWRIKQLQDLGINFSTSFSTKPMLFPELSTTHPPRFNAGILFANSQTTKSDLIKEFLYRISWKPKEIIFVDDEHANVRSVGNAMKKEKIDYLGVHYTAIKNKFRDLDSQAARKEIRRIFC